MAQIDFNDLEAQLKQLVPVLVGDCVEYMQQDPEVAAQYGDTVAELAEQGVVAFQSSLLGAIQIQYSQFLNNQLDWLNQLLTSRQINTVGARDFLIVLRKRYAEDLPPQYSEALLPVIDTIINHQIPN